MARFSLAFAIQTSGRRLNKRVSMMLCETLPTSMLRCRPISPMSWVSGIQLNATSASVMPAPSMIPRMLVIRLACVSTTPFGWPVDPDENWMNARSSGRRSAGEPSSAMERTASTESGDSLRQPLGCAETLKPLQQALLRIDIGSSQRIEHVKKLVTMIVTDPDGNGHRHDAAENAGPESVHELLIAVRKQYQLIAGTHAKALHMTQHAQRPLVELREGDDALAGLVIDVGNVAIVTPVRRQRFAERWGISHRHLPRRGAEHGAFRV